MKTRRQLFLLVLIGLCLLFVGSATAVRDDLRTPDYYETTVRALFKKGQWGEGKKILEEGLERYSDASGLNELAGQYYYNFKEYDNARYFLIRSVREDDGNVRAKHLLVNVAEETKHYSNAICYVNELLEITPYWKGLWKRKIALYRKQENNVEADRLLRRLYQIYPNDTALREDYANRLEENYQTMRKQRRRDEAIRNIEELIKLRSDKEVYYFDLCNLYLQQGEIEKALEIAGKGINVLPWNTELVRKKAGILAGQYRYAEALALVQERLRYSRDGALTRFYNELQLEAARAASQNDPYVLYGKVYERGKSEEALTYMLNTSITRGYFDDALYYLSEARKRYGDSPNLLYKEYTVYRRMGERNVANSLLYKMYAADSTNYDVRMELARVRMEQANELMSDGLYSEAIPHLYFVAENAEDAETASSAWNKIYTCYYERRQYDMALSALDSAQMYLPTEASFVVRKATTYDKQGRTLRALDMLDEALDSTNLDDQKLQYTAAYEEIAVPFIKKLVENGATRKAFDESSRLLEINPSSQLGLHYAINSAALLNRYEDYDRLVTSARYIYPEETFFLVKQSAMWQREGEYRRALDLLRPSLDSLPDNEILVGAFAENSRELAEKYLREDSTNAAISVLDTALVFDADNEELLYTKGLVYERMRLYDSAYVYQKNYKPGIGEVRSHERHLNDLLSRMHRNEITAEYLQGRYGEADVITSVATLSYSRKMENDVVTGRINYSGRDGATEGDLAESQVPGGTGIQLQAEWEHKFSDKWTGMANLAWANRYFPKVTANVGLTHYFENDWEGEVHLGYRRINTYSKRFAWEAVEGGEGEGYWVFDGWDCQRHNLFNVGAGTAKNWDNFRLSGKVDAFIFSNRLYFNASAQAKYFPLADRRTSITAMAGAGTSPEANLIDNAFPGSFDRLNTMVGLGGSYQFTPHVAVGLMGTWYTFYSQMNSREGTFNSYEDKLETTYRNLFNVHAQLVISF